MNEDDFDSLKKVISDPENMKYFLKPYDDTRVTRWINWCKGSYLKRGFGLWAVIYKETGEMIGDCGVSMQLIDGSDKPETGSRLRKDYHQMGIGKEMARAVRDYFFTHFDYDEVYSYMDVDNLPSYKLAEANGMTYLHDYMTSGGELCKVYRITRSESRQRKAIQVLIRHGLIQNYLNRSVDEQGKVNRRSRMFKFDFNGWGYSSFIRDLKNARATREQDDKPLKIDPNSLPFYFN